jgi:hypothetical protein
MWRCYDWGLFHFNFSVRNKVNLLKCFFETTTMENSSLVVITLLLIAFVVYSLSNVSRKKEGYEGYDETTCLALAKKNEKNIADLNESMKKILRLENDIGSAKTTCESNSKTLAQMLENFKE